MTTLINGDCIEVMKDLAANGTKENLILTDLPYGTTACKWDQVVPLAPMWECVAALTYDRTPVVLFGSEPFSTALRASNIKDFRYDWIWVKDTHSNFLNSRRQPGKRHEIISVFYRKQCAYYPQHWTGAKNHSAGKAVGRYEKHDFWQGGYTVQSRDYGDQKLPISLLYFNRVRNPVFPMQKPVPLLEYLIKTYTREGDTVLDFTMGSGSTGIACLNTGRRFIGIEKDADTFALARDRINAHSTSD